jgi:hypothetical protein
VADTPHHDLESDIEANPLPFAIIVVLIGALALWAMATYTYAQVLPSSLTRM